MDSSELREARTERSCDVTKILQAACMQWTITGNELVQHFCTQLPTLPEIKKIQNHNNAVITTNQQVLIKYTTRLDIGEDTVLC